MAILGDSAIFANDAFTSQQWTDLRRSTELSPVHRLMLAVLDDALRCAGLIPKQSNGVARPHRNLVAARHASRKREAVRIAAVAWMLADDSACGPFSFIALCDALGLDAGRLRALVDHPDGQHLATAAITGSITTGDRRHHGG
jgi:hypothetical protein